MARLVPLGFIVLASVLAIDIQAASSAQRPMIWTTAAASSIPRAASLRLASAAKRWAEPNSGNAMQTAMSNAGFQGGLNLYVDGPAAQDGDLAEKAARLSQRLAALGANSVSIAFPIFMSGPNASAIYADPQTTPSINQLGILIAEAHSHHLSVMLRPVLDEQSLIDTQGDWRGSIQPVDRGAWFASYQQLVAGYAQLAASMQVDAIDVGTELDSLQGETDRWRSLIHAVRSVFFGKLTYSVNFDYQQIDFADALDFLAIDAYYPLAAPFDASVNELTAAWQPWLTNLQALKQTVGIPVVITELGVRSQAGAHLAPWVWQSDSGPDLVEQQRYYQASCGSLSQLVDGLYWWLVTLNSPVPRPEFDTTYDPLGKPAEAAIKDCFSQWLPPVTTSRHS